VLLNYALALLSGVLLFLVHPRFDLAFLAPVAIAPLLYALSREWVPKHRFFLGYVTGVTFWAGVNYWIEFVIAQHGGLGHFGGTLVWILFCLAKGLYLGVFGLLAGVLIQKRYAVLAIPALWTGIERVPGPFFYTWLTLGNAGIDMAVPMRLAPYTGVYGLSFLFALFGTAIAWIALRRPRKDLVWLGLVVILALLPRLAAPTEPTRSAVTVQPNVEERDNWTRPEVDSLHQRLEILTLQAGLSRPTPDVVLWPEMPAPMYYFQDTRLRDRVHTAARTLHSSFIIGTVGQENQYRIRNSAVQVSPSGEFKGRYDKIFLVPFGEFIPFPFQGLVQKITNEIGDFEPGERVSVFDLGTHKLGAFICYESAIPHLVRQFPAAGAAVLVNLTNDGYFGKTAAREQHLSLVRMRAAENQRWIIRSTNDGVTASIDPAGRVWQTLKAQVETSDRLRFNYITETTAYSRHGDIFAWTCLVVAIGFLVWSQVPTFEGKGG
jgi:apolipoprotein N-acyltransferase